jgi:Tfp pilus assembly PilM family ATPase
MIRSLFLPDKIGNRYLFSKKIVGVTINYTAVHAVVVTLHNTSITINEILQEPLPQNQELSHEQRVAVALETLMAKVGTYDELRTTLTNVPVIFKELTFPFSDKEKIDLVVRFEVEASLPFAAHEAAIDFIITHVDAATGQATVQVAAVQKKYIQEHLALFSATHVEPATITVDIFNLYSLYRMIPDYYNTGVTALLDIGTNTTKLLYCVDGQLKKIRVIDQGMATIAKQVGASLDLSTGQTIQEILRFGMLNTQNPQYTDHIQQALAEFSAAIRFTLDSCALQTETGQQSEQCIITGIGSEIPQLEQALARNLDAECHLFDSNALITSGRIVIPPTLTVTPAQVPFIANAIPTDMTTDFNLRTEEYTKQQNTRLLYQVSIAGILFVTIITALLVHTFLQQRKLEYAKKSLTNEALASLRDRGLIENERTIKDALNAATEKVRHEEDIWFAFSSQTRFSFLKYLQSLSTALDRAGLQLQLERLDMTESTITLKGEVPSYEKLTLLEQQLNKSGLFVSVPHLQELKFDERLTLKKLNGTP